MACMQSHEPWTVAQVVSSKRARAYYGEISGGGENLQALSSSLLVARQLLLHAS